MYIFVQEKYYISLFYRALFTVSILYFAMVHKKKNVYDIKISLNIFQFNFGLRCFDYLKLVKFQ